MQGRIKTRKIIKTAFFGVFFLLIIRIISLLFVPVGEIISNENDFEKLYNEYSNYDIYVLHYINSSGASWAVRESSDPNMAGKYVILEYPYDIRLLGINEDYHLDDVTEAAVISKKAKKIVFEGEEAYIIKAKKMYIRYDDYDSPTDKKKYYIYDLKPEGIIKALLGLVFPTFRRSF